MWQPAINAFWTWNIFIAFDKLMEIENASSSNQTFVVDLI